ncbi:MAG: replication protein RepA [Rhodospirillaceae bacterium]
MSSVPARIEKSALPTGAGNQFELALQEASDELDISWMHSSFGLAGLPLRPVYDRSQTHTAGTLANGAAKRKELTHFHRAGQSCSLNINSPVYHLPSSDREIPIGVPWGARARLLILWTTTQAQAQAKQNGNRWIEIGSSIKSWLDDVGVPYCLSSINATKEQLIRLSFARFTLIMNHGGRQFFRDDCLFESGIFEDSDLEAYTDGRMTDVRMPLGLKLSQNAYNNFTGRDSIPIPTQALRGISNNSMAIDMFVYFLFRLRSIDENETVLITWKTLISQFGNKEPKSKFIQVFKPSIDKALEALQCATFVVDDEGLRLHHIRPVEFRKLFVVAPKVVKPTRARLANRIPPIEQPTFELVSP